MEVIEKAIIEEIPEEIQKENLVNLTLESAILSKILNDPKQIEQCIFNDLSEQCFFDNTYKKIYACMNKIHRSGEEVNELDIIKYMLKDFNISEKVTLQALQEITSNQVDFKSMTKRVQELRDLSRIRNTRDLIDDLKERLPALSIQELGDELKMITGYTEASIRDANICEDINLTDYKQEEALQTGITAIDGATRGLLRGSLNLISGDSGVGKSTLINQIISNVISEGHKTFIYSGELRGTQVAYWLARSICNTEDLKEYTSELMDEEGAFIKELKPTREALFNIEKYLKGKLFLYNNQNSQDITALETAITRMYKTKGVSLFVIDNLMTVEVKSERDKFEKQRVIASRLKALAIKLDVAIILVLHNRKNKEQGGSFYNIHGASEVVNLADTIINLKRDNDNQDSNDRFLDIQKNRATGYCRSNILLHFSKERKRFFEFFDYRQFKEFKYKPEQIELEKREAGK